jgi:ABC-2 type transport system ATP-binding protein
MDRRTPIAMLATLFLLVVAVPATSAAQDGPTITTQVVESFDGEPIVTHLFLPPGASDDTPVPLVMRTHGWGGTGETGVGGTLEVLLDNGYAVMTWDQRGFGCSGGVVHIDKPDVEGRDVSALIDWAVANAPIATDADGDPIVGFTGGSYAGGIQTATTSIDPRIDAIAPEIAWEDLRYSLYGGQVIKQGWVALLYSAGTATATGLGLSPDCPGFADYGPQEGGLHPLIHQGFAEGATTGTVSEDVLEFFAESSLAFYGQDNPVAIPTLVLQGSVDTLFDLTDGYRQFQHVRANGAPAKFVAFCGGHVACPEFYGDAGDRAHMDDLIVAWFNRYLKGDTSVDTGPTVEYRTNDAQWRTASDFPPANFTWVEASEAGSLISVPGGDSPDPEELADMLAGLQDAGGIPGLPITIAQPANDAELAAGQAFQFEVGVAAGPTELLGIPHVSLTVSGQGDEVILFVKLIHRERNHVINLQEGAVRVPLGDGEVTVDVTMPGIAYTLPDGDHLDLEVSTVSLMHGNARTPSAADVLAAVSVPTGITGDAPSDATGPAPEPDTPNLPSTGAGVGLLALLVGAVAGARRRRQT